MASATANLSVAASGPLAGVRVLDLTVNVLGPVCTQILGDMGCDVTKVEAPEGDYTRYVGPARNAGMGVFYLNFNRNKRSIVLDLKREAARNALLSLAKSADVFVHSMRLGAAERLGINYAQIAAQNPRVIYASVGGYQQTSSRRDWPAYDDVIQGVSGIAAMNGRIDGVPRYFPTVICDKLCGYVLASSIAMALYAREKTGHGQEVHVSMMETMVGFNMLEHLWGGVLNEPERGLGYSRMLTPHRRPYATQDGFISLLATTNEQWRRLFIAIERPDLVADPRFSQIPTRTQNIDALYAIVVDAMRARTSADWRQRLDAADIPNGEVNDFEDLLAHPYLTETGFFKTMDHPSEGPFVAMAIPVEYSKTQGQIRRLPPKLGEHTVEVLREAGFDANQIERIMSSADAPKVR